MKRLRFTLIDSEDRVEYRIEDVPAESLADAVNTLEDQYPQYLVRDVKEFGS